MEKAAEIGRRAATIHVKCHRRAPHSGPDSEAALACASEDAMMKPIAFILLVLALFPISGTLAAGAASAVTDPATFRWAVKCSTIPTPHIVVCRIVPDLEEGVVRRGPAVPVTFQVDNRDGRLVNIGSELSCRELPVVLRFGDGAPFVVRGSGSL